MNQPSTISAEKPSFKIRFWVLDILFQLLIAFWSVAVIVRIFLQDRFPGLSAVYYATPPMVLAVIAIFISIWQFCIRQNERASLWFVISAGCLIWMLCTSIVIPSPFPENRQLAEQTIRGVFWNVGRGMAGWQRILPEAQKLQPDIMGLVEVGFHTEEVRASLKKYFPDYKISMLGGGFALVSKGTASDCTPGTLGDMGEYREVDVILEGIEYRVCLVDIQSHPFRDRRSTLEELALYAERNADRHLIIMGDLNTPTDSLHLQKLRQSCSNAFEVSGNGYIATWPVPFPLLILDQVWVNPHLVPVEAKLGWNYVSDHRPLVVEILPPVSSRNSNKISSLELLPPE